MSYLVRMPFSLSVSLLGITLISGGGDFSADLGEAWLGLPTKLLTGWFILNCFLRFWFKI